MVDLLRGFVIALMVLDHTRDYFHISAYTFDPTDPARTHLLVVSHALGHASVRADVRVPRRRLGVPAGSRTARSKPQLARFLLTRGAWLIVLELTVISFGFNFALPFLFLQVIWAIGMSMILLAGVIWLPRAAAAVIGAVDRRRTSAARADRRLRISARSRRCGRSRSKSDPRRSGAASSPTRRSRGSA